MRHIAVILLLAATAAPALAQDPAPPPPGPAVAPAPAVDGLHLDGSTLVSIGVAAGGTVVGGVLYAGKLLTTGYVKALTEQIAGLSDQLKLAADQNRIITAQNVEQMTEIVKLRTQLASGVCPHLGPDDVCRKTPPAAPAAATVAVTVTGAQPAAAAVAP